jgi:hypothetical protein
MARLIHAVTTCAMAAAVLVAPPSAQGEERVVVADFSSAVKAGAPPAGWKLSERSGRADLAFVRDSGVAAARFRSVDTSFSLQREVKVDLKRFPKLIWGWKVTKLPVGGDFRKSATDDQAAQLFVAFSRSRAIVYVWSSTVPAGTMQSTSPAPGMTVQVVVVRSGSKDMGEWISEIRDVHQDYKKLFGAEPPLVSAVRLQINSQHTKTTAESFFADVAFHATGNPIEKNQVEGPK